MHNLSVTACSFKFRKKNKKRIDVIQNLNDSFIYKEGSNIEKIFSSAEDIFIDFFETFNDYKNDSEDKKLFSCSLDKNDIGETKYFNYILATVRSGSYGFPSKIIDSDTKEEIMQTTNKQAPVKDFYVLVIIPKDNNTIKVVKGLLFFQNIGQYGVKTITTKYLSNYFSKNFNLTTICGNIAPSIFVEKLFKNSAIRDLILVKNLVSDDEADKKGYGKETRTLTKLKWYESLITKLKKFASGSCYTYEFEGIQYDQTKLYADIGGRFRTIDLHNIERLSVIEAIPDEYLLADGTVKKQELLKYFKNLAQEYIDTMCLGD